MMKGKLYRRNNDGYIYEVIGRDETPGAVPCWVLWNDRAGERQIAMEIELERQVGWSSWGRRTAWNPRTSRSAKYQRR